MDKQEFYQTVVLELLKKPNVDTDLIPKLAGRIVGFRGSPEPEAAPAAQTPAPAPAPRSFRLIARGKSFRNPGQHRKLRVEFTDGDGATRDIAAWALDRVEQVYQTVQSRPNSTAEELLSEVRRMFPASDYFQKVTLANFKAYLYEYSGRAYKLLASDSGRFSARFAPKSFRDIPSAGRKA